MQIPLITVRLWRATVVVTKTLRIMRMIAILLTGFCAQVSARALSQHVTFSATSVPLSIVLHAVQQQTGYFFIYNDALIEKAVPVSINATDMPLEAFLDRLFTSQPFTYAVQKTTVVIALKPALRSGGVTHITPLFGVPPISVRGKIMNQNGEPVMASIAVKGSSQGVTTGTDGSFQLSGVAEDATLVISAANIETIEIRVNSRVNVGDIAVTMKVEQMNEVVVNKGYYSERKELSTGSVSKITAKQISKQPVVNLLAAMQGSMPGVDITQESGVPGGEFKIQIRGRNSVRTEGNDPLYIIDGVPFSSQPQTQLSSEAFGSSRPSPLNGINAADVESIEVLKDADATAIYGSRGANGVVLVTTKRGRAGETSFFVDAYKGAGKIARSLKLLNTQQYLEMRREAFLSDGLSESSPEYALAYDINGTWDPKAYTDWQKELTGGSAGSSQLQAGIMGGNNQTRFLLSGTVSKENSVFPGDYAYDKSSVHVNLSHGSVNQKFNASLSASYVTDKNDLPGGSLTSAALSLPPNHPALRKESGELNWDNVYDNPLAAMESNYLLKNNTLVASGSFGYQIAPGLEFKTALGFSDGRINESKTTPHTSYNPSWGYGNTPAASRYSLNTGGRQSWSVEPQLSWTRAMGKGSLNILAGLTWQESRMSNVLASGYGFTTNELITNLSAASQTSVYTNQSLYRYSAGFGRINYSLLDRYVLNLTARRDGSSRFGPGKRFGNFGAVGAAWIMTKEPSINQLIGALSFGKLKASYGTSGNDQIGDYQFLNTFTTDYSNYDGVVGLRPTRLFNPNFSWETNKKLELGLETGWFGDRLLFNVSYYRNRSSSQLVGIPLPFTTGFSSVQANLNATVQNTGWEFELRTTSLLASGIRWTNSVNLTIPQNKLISFPNLEASTFSDYIIGRSLSIRRAYYSEGVNPATGVYAVKDVNGDGIAEYANDRTNLVDLSRSLFAGVSSELSVGPFEFSVLFQLVKQTGLNYIGTWPNVPGNMGNQPVQVLERWQKPGDEKPVQRYTALYGDVYNAYWKSYGSQKGLGDASFIRLKNLSASYHFNSTWLKVKDCRVYVQAQNLFTLTGFDGPDPESQYMYNLPPIRMITAGIKLTL